ncbi:MAG: hypothetical protein JW795_06930, partial [Chitinivibrionales bacterium]|nr:hypothetical protein [Chitinivibrionales bacterium]
MDKYKFLSTTPFRRLLYRQDAIALLYVMIAVLFTAAISTMLMKLSHYDVTASKDMSSMTTAAISARAALDGFEALAAASPNRILDTLNRFLKGTSQGWLFDSAMTKATLSDQQRFTTRIINFDKTNMVARIEGIGYGKGGSSKKVIGVYKLGNVAFPPATSIGKNVLFINGDISFDSRLIIKGGVYCKADKFDLSSSWNTGSEFYGPVIIKGNAELRGTYTFKDIVLCKGTFDIVPDGTFQLTFEKKSAFGGNFNELYLSSETITMK